MNSVRTHLQWIIPGATGCDCFVFGCRRVFNEQLVAFIRRTPWWSHTRNTHKFPRHTQQKRNRDTFKKWTLPLVASREKGKREETTKLGNTHGGKIPRTRNKPGFAQRPSCFSWEDRERTGRVGQWVNSDFCLPLALRNRQKMAISLEWKLKWILLNCLVKFFHFSR